MALALEHLSEVLFLLCSWGAESKKDEVTSTAGLGWSLILWLPSRCLKKAIGLTFISGWIIVQFQGVNLIWVTLFLKAPWAGRFPGNVALHHCYGKGLRNKGGGLYPFHAVKPGSSEPSTQQNLMVREEQTGWRGGLEASASTLSTLGQGCRVQDQWEVLWCKLYILFCCVDCLLHFGTFLIQTDIFLLWPCSQ